MTSTIYSQLSFHRWARRLGSARREVLDHVLLVDHQHLACLLRQYQSYFNESHRIKGSANAYQRIL
jgi:hypothetical protein